MFNILKQGTSRFIPIEPKHKCKLESALSRQDLRGVRSDIRFKIKQMVHKNFNIQAQDVEKWLSVEYSDLDQSWKPDRNKISQILDAEKKKKNVDLESVKKNEHANGDRTSQYLKKIGCNSEVPTKDYLPTGDQLEYTEINLSYFPENDPENERKMNIIMPSYAPHLIKLYLAEILYNDDTYSGPFYFCVM